MNAQGSTLAGSETPCFTPEMDYRVTFNGY